MKSPRRQPPKASEPIQPAAQVACSQSAHPPTVKLRSQDWAIQALPGLDADNQAKLIEQGIVSTLQLWRQTATPEQRLLLANELHIHPQYVTKWAALADLSRLPSVGCQYCGLLLHAGIASPTQLAQMPFHKVHQQVVKLHIATLNQTAFCPTLSQAKQWVEEASLLNQEGMKRLAPERSPHQ